MPEHSTAHRLMCAAQQSEPNKESLARGAFLFAILTTVKKPNIKKNRLLIILILVMLVSALTALYFKSQRQTTSDSNNIKSSDLAINYTGSRVALSGATLVIPDGWEIERPSFRQGLIFADNLSYRPGAGTVYTDTEAQADISRFMVSADTSPGPPKEYLTYAKSPWQKGSLKGYHYYYQFGKGEKVGSYVMQGGEKEYMYYLTKGNGGIHISYFVLDGDVDQHDLFEQVVETVEF
jgi:hypothetical protein